MSPISHSGERDELGRRRKRWRLFALLAVSLFQLGVGLLFDVFPCVFRALVTHGNTNFRRRHRGAYRTLIENAMQRSRTVLLRVPIHRITKKNLWVYAMKFPVRLLFEDHELVRPQIQPHKA